MTGGMSRLLCDRYLQFDDGRAWDLATGQAVPLEAVTAATGRDAPAIAAFSEVLDHGLEGVPRWLVARVPSAAAAAGAIRRVATDAAARGFVPIAVADYLRLRETLAAELRDRALVLIGDADDCGARAALIVAAAQSPRPHVLLTLRQTPASATVVREARAAYAPAPVAGARSGRVRLQGDAIGHWQRVARALGFIRDGRHAAADRLLREAAAALTRRGLPAHAAHALIAAGQLSLERGHPEVAQRLLEQAADSGAPDDVVAAARTWQATARLDAGQLTAAESICRALLVTGGSQAEWRPAAEATLGRVLLWQGRVEEALQLRIIDDDPGADASALVRGTAIRLLIAGGRMFDAGQRARRFLDVASAAADPGVVIAAAKAHLRVLIASGDLVLAEAQYREVIGLARAAHLPLRAARARLLWHEALCRAGRHAEAAHQLRALRRIAAAAPPLLRHAITRCAQPDRRDVLVRVVDHGSRLSAAGLVELCNAEDADAGAVARVLEALHAALRASRVDLCSAAAGPVSTVASAGAGLSTVLAGRVLAAGISIGPEAGPCEVGVPVRLGSRLLGALVARWPLDRSCSPAAAELLTLAAAVIAPRLEALHASTAETAAAATAVPELIGISDAMNEVRRGIARAAAAPFAVLIEGESGAGKELVARAIHQLSVRRQRRFCDVNCAALPDDLLESELFGHARGAFTGAVAERPGLFEDADGGTLFLDEVADLSPRAQAKLLRVLQQHEVRRVGETFSRTIDVRIVAAANRDMREAADTGRFRHDLLYRLDVIRLRVPPLRERSGDIAVLAAHFWTAAAARVGTSASLTHGVLAALTAYAWPGNVRQLQNAIAALAVAAPARGVVRASLLPAAIAGSTPTAAMLLADARTSFERRFVEAALARAGGNRARAARDLGVSRQGLAKLLARLQLSHNATAS